MLLDISQDARKGYFQVIIPFLLVLEECRRRSPGALLHAFASDSQSLEVTWRVMAQEDGSTKLVPEYKSQAQCLMAEYQVLFESVVHTIATAPSLRDNPFAQNVLEDMKDNFEKYKAAFSSEIAPPYRALWEEKLFAYGQARAEKDIRAALSYCMETSGVRFEFPQEPFSFSRAVPKQWQSSPFIRQAVQGLDRGVQLVVTLVDLMNKAELAEDSVSIAHSEENYQEARKKVYAWFSDGLRMIVQGDSAKYIMSRLTEAAEENGYPLSPPTGLLPRASSRPTPPPLPPLPRREAA